MQTRTYAAVVVALTYGHIYGFQVSPGALAARLDDLAAVDVYSDAEECPPTLRCPESGAVTERPIQVVVAS